MASDESSEERQNYMKVFNSLMFAKEGLDSFTDKEINKFHVELRFQTRTSGVCGKCLRNDIEQQWRKGIFSCINNICDKWLLKLKLFHMRDKVNIEWNNIDISLLPTSALECAKVFFNRKKADISQEVGEYVQESDIAALLKLYLDCLYFQDKVNIDDCNEVLSIRNTIMHSGTMEMETSQMYRCITSIVRFLQDPATLARDIGCKRASDKIKQMYLRDSPFSVGNVPPDVKMHFKHFEAKIDNLTKAFDNLCKIFMEDRSNRPTDDRSVNGRSYSREIEESSQIKSAYTPTLDGRLRNLPKNVITSMIGKATVLTEGIFGTTYLFHDASSGHPRMVIKKIVCKDKRDNRKSYIQKMLVSRLKHPGIVPLFAGTWDEEMETYYFILPYMGRDLHTALKEDRKRFTEGLAPILTNETRRRIVLQLALLLQFFHKHSYIHGAVITKNIVLDAQFNMRLLDLGLSRLITEHRDIAGYRPRNNPEEISEKTDIFSYGVVVLEIMTGLPLVDEDGVYLHEISDVFMNHGDQIEHIWGENAVPRDLNAIAKACRGSSTAKKIIETAIDKLTARVNKKFCQIPETNPKCNLCMKNHIVDRGILNHDCDVRFCVACIRSFYPDPIQCPLCQKDILSPVGDGWGAIFVAGNCDRDSALAQSFKEDVSRVKRSITSKKHLAMGLREEGVRVVEPGGPATTHGLLGKLEIAVDRFKSEQLAHIHTLILYFSGHCNADHELVLFDSKETITDDRLIDLVLERAIGVRKLITILDCCYPNKYPYIQDLSDSIRNISLEDIKIIKLIACNSDTEAIGDRTHGSEFTNCLVQCLAGRNAHELCNSRGNVSENCDICQNEVLLRKCDDGFISIEYFKEYIGRHMEKAGYAVPVSSEVGTTWKDSKLAFCLPELPIEIFNENGNLYRLNELPDSIDELMDQLLYKAKGTLDGNRMKHFKDIYSIVTKTGPGLHDTRELINVKQIEDDICALHRIYVVPRVIQHIGHNKSVGIFLDNEDFDTQAVIDCIRFLWNIDCRENDIVLEVAVPLTIPGRRPNRRPPSCPSELENPRRFLSKKLDILKALNKDREVKLLLMFPYKSVDDSRRDVESKFFLARLGQCN